MIDISGHLRSFRSDQGFQDLKNPVTVNCCGYQQFLTRGYTKKRPAGRLDYQLLYLYEGSGTFLLEGGLRRLGPGSLILYRPKEPQVYSYCPEDSPLVFWIHFTGSRIPRLLEEYEIHTGNVGVHSGLRAIFEEVILELTLKKKAYRTVVESCFYKLLAVLYRLQYEAPLQTAGPIEALIVELNQNYSRNWTVAAMAEYCSLSPDYFAHCFRAAVQDSPLHYLTGVRIEKAKELLQGSEIPISDAAATVGFENPLYFSRVFKKCTGMAPRDYRRNFLMAQEQEPLSYI